MQSPTCDSPLSRQGFTLIELSIVLVIIGLIVGGVLVGRDLMKAAEVRAQISQIEKYNQAVNTFRGKYGYLPGDIKDPEATQFGFSLGSGCTGTPGRRDGNGLIEGWYTTLGGSSSPANIPQTSEETQQFWLDLSSTVAGNMIGEHFSVGNAFGCGQPTAQTTSGFARFLPAAKLGHSSLIYVYENNGINWFAIANGYTDYNGSVYSDNPCITVLDAYNFDKKIDDGLPDSRNVIAQYLNAGIVPAANTPTSGGTSSSCYDTTTHTYSVGQNNGVRVNCGLSFKFQ